MKMMLMSCKGTHINTLHMRVPKLGTHAQPYVKREDYTKMRIHEQKQMHKHIHK